MPSCGLRRRFVSFHWFFAVCKSARPRLSKRREYTYLLAAAPGRGECQCIGAISVIHNFHRTAATISSNQAPSYQ